ncbi:hypothetical protein D3C72_2385830 [compost metagenome]
MRAATGGAGVAAGAFCLALQTEQTELAGQRQARAHRAQVFAVGALAEQRQAQNGADKEPEWPAAVPYADQESGLEGFDFGQMFGRLH